MRSRCAARADIGQYALLVARHADQRVEHARDRQTARGEFGADRIDEKRHVIIDDRDAHQPLALRLRHGGNTDRGMARGALQRDIGHKRRGFGAFATAKADQLARKRARNEPFADRLNQSASGGRR